MIIELTPETILIYYDLPQLFVGVDQVGTKYISLLVDSIDSVAKYLTKPVAVSELMDLVTGRVELRSLLRESRMNAWYYLDSADDRDFKPLTQIAYSEIPDKYWPDVGFKLDTFFNIADESLVQEAYRKGRVVVSLTVSEPGKSGESTASAFILADLLRHYQAVVKYAYKKAISHVKSESRKALDRSENYLLSAFATSPGSFRIYLQAHSQRDLFGVHDIDYALKSVDDLVTEEDDKIIDRLRANRGHAVSSYAKLLETISKNHITFSYSWVDPSVRIVSSRSLNDAYATRVLDLISSRQDLGTETRTIEGYLLSADVVTGNWHLRDDDGVDFVGKGQGEILKDRTLFTQRYRVVCEEHLEEELVSGKEKTSLNLLSIEPI